MIEEKSIRETGPNGTGGDSHDELMKHKASNMQIDPAENDALENDEDQLERGLNFYTVLVLFTAVLGGLVFGLDIGTTACTSMDGFRNDTGMPLLRGQDSPETVQKLSLFAVLFHVSSLIGAPFAGTLADRYGRKLVMIVASCLFISGAIWQACSGLISVSFAYTSVLLGRVVAGLGNGLILTVMPLYSAELSPPRYRGKVVTLFQFFITIGIFIMAVVNESIQDTAWGWRLGISLQCIPSLIILILVLTTLPESPRYLMKKDKSEEAKEALLLLSKGDSNKIAIVQFEMDQMNDEILEMRKVGEGGFKELFVGTALPAFLCGFMVAFSQNVTGVNWFMNYATILFSSLNFPPFTYDLILKSINMVATLGTLFVVDRYGRKFLTLWGTIFVILVFFLIATVITATGVDITSTSSDPTVTSVQLFCVIMIFLFQAVFAVTWGPIGWLVPSEVFPLRLRGVGMSSAVVANMLTNIALGDFGYNNMVASTSLATTAYIVFALNVVIVLSTVVFLQPETKGITMEDMRFVFAYEKGGNPEENHLNLRSFYRRNFKQGLSILRCRKANTRMGFERFHKHEVDV